MFKCNQKDHSLWNICADKANIQCHFISGVHKFVVEPTFLRRLQMLAIGNGQILPRQLDHQLFLAILLPNAVQPRDHVVWQLTIVSKSMTRGHSLTYLGHVLFHLQTMFRSIPLPDRAPPPLTLILLIPGGTHAYPCPVDPISASLLFCCCVPPPLCWDCLRCWITLAISADDVLMPSLS